MAGHKITSLWQLQIDPSELPPEGTVTGAAASRLGAHVGARIRQLREAQLAAEQAANASTTLRGQTKDRNGDKKLTSSNNEFITMGAPENDKHSTENRVVIMTANSNKKTTTSEDDAVKIKKPSPDTKGNLKVNKQTLNSTSIKNETIPGTTKMNAVHESAPRPLPRNKNSLNIENQNKVNINYNSHAVNNNVTHNKWNQVDSTEITKPKDDGLITAREENNDSKSTSNTNINEPKITFKLRKPSLHEETTKLQPTTEITKPKYDGLITAREENNDSKSTSNTNINEPKITFKLRKPSLNEETTKLQPTTEITKPKDDGLITAREENNDSKSTSNTNINEPKTTFKLRKPSLNEETKKLQPTSAQFYIHQTNDIAARNIKYPASENHENMRKVIPLDLKDDDDLSDRDEDVMQFKEETIHLKTITTPEQTLELRLTVSDVSNLTSNYSPTQRRQSGFDSSDRRGSVDARRGSVDARRGSIDSRRGSLLSPDLIKILPGDDEDACDICRRNSEPFARYNRSFSISSDYIMPNIPESESDSKRGSFFSDENLEAISLKLDAIVVNAEYIESRARDGEERHELEEEAARTQGALDDVAILDREEMQERVTRAARALARCRMILEERAPSIASYETMDRRRSSAVADQQIIRSVALRVMALDSQEAARRRTDSDRRGSIDSRRGSIQEGRRGSMY